MFFDVDTIWWSWWRWDKLTSFTTSCQQWTHPSHLPPLQIWNTGMQINKRIPYVTHTLLYTRRCFLMSIHNIIFPENSLKTTNQVSKNTGFPHRITHNNVFKGHYFGLNWHFKHFMFSTLFVFTIKIAWIVSIYQPNSPYHMNTKHTDTPLCFTSLYSLTDLLWLCQHSNHLHYEACCMNN